MAKGKFKVVVQRPATGSLFGENAYEMEREALDPVGATIVEVGASSAEEFVAKAKDADAVIGIGKFAERRASAALAGMDVEVRGCWHPSPASPLANRNGGRDWRENVSSVLH